MGTEDKKNKIFISHSSNDAKYVKAIVELLEDIGLGKGEIVCSSVDIYKIPLGKSIFDYLAEQFQNYNLHVLFILSKNYYTSIASQNEMGAAWVLKHRYDTILLPGMQFDDVKGCIDKSQIGINLDGEEEELKHRLNELQENVVKEFSKPAVNISKWERNRGEFLNRVKNLRAEEEKENKNVPPRKEDSSNQTDRGNKDLDESLSMDASILLVYAAEERGGIFIMRDGRGTHVQTGMWDVAGDSASPRIIARWEAAVKELLHLDLIQRKSGRDRIYGVTHDGYQMADKIKEKLKIDKSKSPYTYIFK